MGLLLHLMSHFLHFLAHFISHNSQLANASATNQRLAGDNSTTMTATKAPSFRRLTTWELRWRRGLSRWPRGPERGWRWGRAGWRRRGRSLIQWSSGRREGAGFRRRGGEWWLLGLWRLMGVSGHHLEPWGCVERKEQVWSEWEGHKEEGERGVMTGVDEGFAWGTSFNVWERTSITCQTTLVFLRSFHENKQQPLEVGFGPQNGR